METCLSEILHRREIGQVANVSYSASAPKMIFENIELKLNQNLNRHLKNDKANEMIRNRMLTENLIFVKFLPFLAR